MRSEREGLVVGTHVCLGKDKREVQMQMRREVDSWYLAQGKADTDVLAAFRREHDKAVGSGDQNRSEWFVPLGSISSFQCMYFALSE